MEKKVVIKEIEAPNPKVELDGKQYELLCEFQGKDGGFQRVFVQDAGEDVFVEIGKDSAVVGLFSVEDGKVGALFDYIEASLKDKDGIVCWLAGEFDQLLEKVCKDGGKYPMIRCGVGLDEKLPMFYRQKGLDSLTARVIAEHTFSVDYTQEAEHSVAAHSTELGTRNSELENMSLLDDLDVGFGREVDGEDLGRQPKWDEHFWLPRKVAQSAGLPEGWKWTDYVDLSGHLEAPDGKEYFQYDVNVGSHVEFKDKKGDWCRFDGKLSEFKRFAEESVLDFVLNDIEGEKNMGDMRFYVIDDKRTCPNILYFEDIGAALEHFQEMAVSNDKFPALGVEIGVGMLDLLHGVHGETVLVPDYRDMTNFSDPFRAAEGDIQEIVRWLIEDKWAVRHEYQNDILPVWVQGEMSVLVPVTLGNEPANSYCIGKVLKAELPSGIDAIDSLYIENHGWVAYNELLKHPKEYVADGVIKVPQLNVVYVQEKNLVGIDGRMDVAPHDFKAMVADISKPYSLVVYDSREYDQQYRNKHEFIVASFDTVEEAIKGWYEVHERKDVPLLVQSNVTGKQRVFFNGFDKNSHRMSYQQAMEKFHIKDDGIDGVLADAKAKAGEYTNTARELNLDM